MDVHRYLVCGHHVLAELFGVCERRPAAREADIEFRDLMVRPHMLGQGLGVLVRKMAARVVRQAEAGKAARL